MVRVFLDEPLRAGLVDGPRLLEVLDGLRDTLSVESRIDLLADPSDALREAERHGQHLAVPARNHRVRVGHRGHIDHAVLSDLLDLPWAPADDEVQALAGLDHHELLAEDTDLSLRRKVEDRIAALVANCREVLEVIAAALRRDADPVAFLANDAQVREELGDAVRMGVVELAKRLGASDRQEDLGPGRRASLVERGSDNLVGQDVEGEAMDVQRLEVLFLRGLDGGEGLDRVVGRNGENQPARCSVERVARSPDALNQGCNLAGGVVLDDPVNGSDVDAELQSTCTIMSDHPGQSIGLRSLYREVYYARFLINRLKRTNLRDAKPTQEKLFQQGGLELSIQSGKGLACYASRGVFVFR